MSDPIAEYMAEEFEVDIDWTEKVAKQIRQQIGRELLEKGVLKPCSFEFTIGEDDIREVCKLEES